MHNTLPIKALDNAYVQHVGRLFERFCTDITQETTAEDRKHTRVEIKKALTNARVTHQEMIDQLDA